ncbi:hypothetical protein DYU11_07300 [Fibrisoma montanum]|uniref:Uncharacterized protein n=1 Tax=Fibrisoma montanum TaxID=2305895 RepID=A0A418MEB4_9BACT|nr:hypothetical protein [Fibrisoma montanum]RIV25116.1 hypothetical protein DYU11_07300 [Fibrisoma montanum]
MNFGRGKNAGYALLAWLMVLAVIGLITAAYYALLASAWLLAKGFEWSRFAYYQIRTNLLRRKLDEHPLGSILLGQYDYTGVDVAPDQQPYFLLKEQQFRKWLYSELYPFAPDLQGQILKYQYSVLTGEFEISGFDNEQLANRITSYLSDVPSYQLT